MKTSILISSFAALCLVITFAESTTRHSVVKNNSNDLISFVPVCMVHPVPECKVLLKPGKNSSERTPVLTAEVFSFPKFKVADYIDNDFNATTEPGILPELSDSDCSYLKFDVTDFTDNMEVSLMDDFELPKNEFDYLRFDVNNYLEQNSDRFETMDLPADNFSCLKFDVNEYVKGSEKEAGTIGKLPVEETQACDSSDL
jgi:hypothetical protein